MSATQQTCWSAPCITPALQLIVLDDSPEMSLVDDTAEVRWHGGIITKELLDNFLWDGQDIVVDCLLAQQVIRCNASLSRIQELTPQQAFHGHADIARAVYVRRAETSRCMLFKILGGAGRGKSADGPCSNLLPPSSKMTGVRCSFAACRTILPTLLPPV